MMFIEDQYPGIKTFVGTYREDGQKLTYLELGQYARAKGNAFCARDPQLRSKPEKALISEGKSTSLSIGADELPKLGYDNGHIAHGDSGSVPMLELPSTLDGMHATARDDNLLYAKNDRAQAPRIPYANGYHCN